MLYLSFINLIFFMIVSVTSTETLTVYKSSIFHNVLTAVICTHYLRMRCTRQCSLQWHVHRDSCSPQHYLYFFIRKNMHCKNHLHQNFGVFVNKK